jgi:RNA polymerase sigma factor (sigma-70 family)
MGLAQKPPSHAATADAELIAACRDGAPGAWEALIHRFERLIYTVPRRAGLAPEEAADVFQTVFMRLHEHLHTLAQPDRVQAWLVTTARRETLRTLQERQRAPLLAPERSADDDDEAGSWAPEPVDPNPLPEQLLDELQQRHRARQGLAALGEPCQSLLTLLYLREEPLPYAEISAQLGMPLGSLGPTRARCLAKLRASLEAA